MITKNLTVSIYCLATALSSATADTLKVPQDHPTIQSAIDAAEVGDVLLISPGVYRERLRLKPGISVRSVGDDSPGELGLKRAEATIIDGDGLQTPEAGVTMAEGATLDGLTIQNIGKYDDEQWNHHHQTQGNEQSHEHIGAPGVAGISITGVTCIVRNSIVHHVGYTGIAISGTPGSTCSPHILRNICYRNMGGGIGSMNGSTAIIEENTCFQNFYAGIGHDNASPHVLNNTCYENIRAGIGISEGACPVIIGNRCYRNRRAGIGTRTGANTQPRIINNECYDNDMAGIGADEAAAPFIQGNRCYKNKLAGIGVRDHSQVTMIGNECYENAETGIGQQGDAITMLINNYCHKNGESGIGFAECESGRSTLIKNRIINNAKVAVGIHSGWRVELLENELSRDGGLPPIVMVFAGAEANFTNNTIRGGGVAGIRVAGKVHAANNQFIAPSLRKVGPPSFGIWALPGANVTLTKNQFDSWRHALHATQATVLVSGNNVKNFSKAAFVVKDSASPASLFDNIAITHQFDTAVVSVSGPQGIVLRNSLQGEGPQSGNNHE